MSDQIDDGFERHQDEMVVLALAMATGAIEAQEKLGQMALLNAKRLPKAIKVYGAWSHLGWREFAPAWGITILAGAADDDIFHCVELSPGWIIVPTHHAMWTRLIDAQGRERAAIFYKAAFYDRSAHIHPIQRYEYTYDMLGKDRSIRHAYIKDHATNAPIHVFTPDLPADDWAAGNKLDQEGYKWLEEHYPEHRNPLAYW